MSEGRSPWLLVGSSLVITACLALGIYFGIQSAGRGSMQMPARDESDRAVGAQLTGGVEGAPTEGLALPDAPATPDTGGLTTGIVVEGRASLGEAAPEFELERIEGGMGSLSDYAGQPVLLNFWATWCAPCRIEMPYLEAVHAKHADEGLVVLGVNVGESTAEVEPYLQELGLTFPVVLDQNRQVAQTYRVGTYPTTVFIDREGRIINVRRGAFVNEPDLRSSLSMIMPEIED